MKVKFKKGKERDLLECTRVDGIITCCKSHPGMIFRNEKKWPFIENGSSFEFIF